MRNHKTFGGILFEPVAVFISHCCSYHTCWYCRGRKPQFSVHFLLDSLSFRTYVFLHVVGHTTIKGSRVTHQLSSKCTILQSLAASFPAPDIFPQETWHSLGSPRPSGTTVAWGGQCVSLPSNRARLRVRRNNGEQLHFKNWISFPMQWTTRIG